MSHHPLLRKAWHAKLGFVAFALAALCLADSGSAVDTKVVGATLLSLQYPFLVTLQNALQAEAAKEGIGLVPLDPRQSVATELSQVRNLISQKVDLILMIPVDQKTARRLPS